jgi:hypothetical protein
VKEFPDISDDELFKALGRVRRISDVRDGEAHGSIARRNRAVGESCRRGDFINCANLIVSGLTVDGGSAEIMIAEARALASIPDELERITEAHGGRLWATANVPRGTAFQVTLHATGGNTRPEHMFSVTNRNG